MRSSPLKQNRKERLQFSVWVHMFSLFEQLSQRGLKVICYSLLESNERCLQDHQSENKRPCDVFEIIKLTQTRIASLKNALDVASQALLAERQSIEHHPQDYQREHKRPYYDY